jgi:Uncharacterized protein conserved in archaea
MVAIVVILASTISVFTLAFTEDANQPGPIVGQSSDELVPQDGSDGGIVRINHIAGDTIQVSNMQVIVDASDACGKQGRLVNLPVPSGGNDIDQSNIEGDDIFDQRAYGFDAVPGPNTIHRSEYAAGEQIAFRVTGGSCSINQGDAITVRVAHTPTNSVVIKETLTAA